jgi:hypothetical protein
MDIETIKSLLEILASWPVAIVIVALLFRKHLSAFFVTVRKGKVGPVEFERFDRILEKSEAAVEDIERLQLLIAKARLAELRAVDDSPYAPTEHKPALRIIADELQQQIELLEKAQHKSGV